jgi:hypothetical protein
MLRQGGARFIKWYYCSVSGQITSNLANMRLFPFFARENYFEHNFGCWSPKFLV